MTREFKAKLSGQTDKPTPRPRREVLIGRIEMYFYGRKEKVPMNTLQGELGLVSDNAIELEEVDLQDLENIIVQLGIRI